MPVLFPIGAFAFAVLYVVEKAMIYYSYRLPPTYDEQLNDSVIDMLTYAPILFFSFGYWMMNNSQIFGNDIVWKQTLNE